MNAAKQIRVERTNNRQEAGLVDRPAQMPSTQPDGSPLRRLPEIILQRRATSRFKAQEVPDTYLSAILHLAAQAPSGYNLQPWRFIVVKDEIGRRRLQKVAMNQKKVAEAPVVIIAIGMKEEWHKYLTHILEEGAKRGSGNPEKIERAEKGALDFLSHQKMDVWVTRHTMIAVTYLMLVAEAYGFDTAPMEGFDPAGVKREFAIPDEAEVVALLALGKAEPPDKAYPGRFSVQKTVFYERYGRNGQ